VAIYATIKIKLVNKNRIERKNNSNLQSKILEEDTEDERR
jgi:hypothetical protein